MEIANITHALSLVARLREISKNIGEAEFKNVLADLANTLGDVRLEAANLKEELAKLRDENRILRETISPVDEKPVGTKWGCYQFEGDSGLYCTACWDSSRKKSLTTRYTSTRRGCPVCQAVFGA